jgi:hypothetical protein
MGLLQEAVAKIRQVGITNVRISPISGDTKHQIEIQENGSWIKILNPMEKNMAEDVLRQASNKVILG